MVSGSDFPVESHDPLLGLYAAVTRQQPDGTPKTGWSPEERMTRDEALASFVTFLGGGRVPIRDYAINQEAETPWIDKIMARTDSVRRAGY